MKLLTVAEAAPLLGKTPYGVRELVERSRRAALGKPVRGSTIRFAQDGKWGAIHFKQEWIDEYLDAITVTPVEASPVKRRKPGRVSAGALDPIWGRLVHPRP